MVGVLYGEGGELSSAAGPAYSLGGIMRILVAAIVAILGFQDPRPWRIVFQSWRPREFVEFKSVSEDGSGLRDEESEPTPFGWSPDRRRRLFVLWNEGVGQVCVFDTDSKTEIPLTEGKANKQSPCWTGDGKQIVFASNEGGSVQIWIMDADGRNPKRLTNHPDGATQPRVLGKRIAYLQQHAQPREKLPPSTLRTMDLTGADSRVLIEKSGILGHEWNPSGDRLACSLIQELRIIDAASGKTVRSFSLEEIHKGLHAHAAYGVLWRPDGEAIACTIGFLGGRMAGAGDFGDNKLFILPMNGKPAIVDAGGSALPWQWTR